MKAYVIEQAGGPEVLQLRDVVSKAPNSEEVRIRVRAFGLNRAEIYRRAGNMGPITGQVVPGIEAVGEVIEDPSGTFRVGQKVATAMGGLQFSRFGSYAEEVTVLRNNVIDIDGTSLSWEELAALPESYLTVWGALGRLVDSKPQQTLLVRGATSSVGQAAVVYAKARGLQVIATTRAVENIERLKAIGADQVIVDTGEISAQVLEIHPQGVDIVLEVVGASTLRDSVKAIKPFGQCVVVGLLGGAPVLENLSLMGDLPNAVSISFFPSGLLGTAALSLKDAPLKWIAGQLAAAQIPSLRVKTFQFEDILQAHSLVESNRAVGKVVVLV